MGDVMSKFVIDYSRLENKLLKKAYKLEQVKDQIERVGFDVVRFKDGDNAANLWQIQSAEDGDYIVSIYEDDSAVEKTASNWQVSISKTAGDLQIHYKSDPLVKIASSKLGIPRAELSQVQQYLPAKLAENKKLVNALLNELPESAKKEALSKYPELV
jgi:hypothetical protein